MHRKMILDLLDVFWKSKGNLLNSIMRLKFRIPFSRTAKNTELRRAFCNPLHSFPFRQGANETRSSKRKYFE